jgi:methylamine--corrinoid protein Co-methyltransferase
MELSREYQLLLETLDKSENGPIVDEAEWDNKIITETARRLVKQYNIAWDSESAPYVFADDEFADRVYEAAYQMALEVGVYCLDTNRRMLWNEKELDEILALSKQSIISGYGSDQVTITNRVPDDERPANVGGGPIGVPTPERMYSKYLEAYARESILSSLGPPTLMSAHERPIRAGSPWEAVGGWLEAQLSLEAVQRAGRPGISVSCVNVATTEVGELAGSTYGAYRMTDTHVMAFISEFKTAYHQLTKAIHHAHIGSIVVPYFNPMYGGFLGGGPGVALAVAAGLILARACYGGHLIDVGPVHLHLSCSTHPYVLRATGLGFQAVARNSNIMMSSFIRTAAGPGTKQILYEVAALTIAAAVSGTSVITGVQSARGTHDLHATPLEARFSAQVAQAVGGMSRVDADPIVSSLIEKYVDKLDQENIGKPFTELYDMETLKPLNPWEDLYLEVCQEFKLNYGLDLAV